MTAKLGVCDEECPHAKLSPYENKIGGYPDLYPTVKLGSLPLCRHCGRPLLLLVQVYCPLEGSEYHRLIHTYCCARRECWSSQESWLVLRSQMIDTNHGAGDKFAAFGGNSPSSCAKAGLNMDVGDWCDGADQWDVESSTGVQQQAKAAVSSGGTATTVTTESRNGEEVALAEEFKASAQCSGVVSFTGPCLPSFYIDVFEETEGGEGNLLRIPKRYEAEADNAGDDEHVEGSSWSGEKYEKGVAKHGDRVFEKFHKVISKWPEQILRYNYSGRPLFMRSTANVFKPECIKCKHCGSPCVYEFQLMPTLVYIVQKSVREKHGNSGTDLPLIEFGTIVVYTCSKSCWDDSCPQFREEHCFVQSDPDESLVNAFPPLCN